MFERGLWASRLVILVAVVASVVLALGAFWIALVDVYHCFALLVDYADPSLDPRSYSDLRSEAVTTIVKALDGFLIGALLLLFAFGLYKLFVGDISAAEGDMAAPRLLVVSSLNDLKDKVARLVLLVLAIEFFGRALSLDYATSLDLLYLAGGILLVSAALYLSGLRPTLKPAPPVTPGKTDRKPSQVSSEACRLAATCGCPSTDPEGPLLHYNTENCPTETLAGPRHVASTSGRQTRSGRLSGHPTERARVPNRRRPS